jgi:NurA-like 5'-3' nuclease
MPQWPEGVNIVTWNYDTQLEKSFKEFCRDPGFVYKGITNSKNITRLNGVCGVPDREDMRDLCYSDFDESYLERVQRLFEGQMKNSRAVLPSISFAWEKKNGLEEEVIKRVRGTTTLVVIGYSFQYFNRDVDEILLLSMVDMGGQLERIFIQVAENEQSAVQERLLTLFDNEDVKKDIKGRITPVSTGLFYIPDNMPG